MLESWRGTPPKFDILNLRVEKNRNLLGATEIQGRGQGSAMADRLHRAPFAWVRTGVADIPAQNALRGRRRRKIERKATPEPEMRDRELGEGD